MSQQVPNDGVVITDLIGRVRPDLVIELGTAGGGGSVQWAAAMRRYSASARLLTIDPASDKLAGTPLTPWNFRWGAFDRCPHCVHLTQTPEWAAGTIRFVRELPTSSRALAIAHEAASKNQVGDQRPTATQCPSPLRSDPHWPCTPNALMHSSLHCGSWAVLA